jgi:protease I
MDLTSARVAVLVENLYQELELWYPVLRLREAGVQVLLVGPRAGEVYGSKNGYPAVAEAGIDDVSESDFDAVIVPGGFSPEYLRRNPSVVKLVQALDARGATVAAICHAGWLLSTAKIVAGRNVTSVPVIRDDVANAGGVWHDQAVVIDGNLITAQLPNDLPEFTREVLDALEKAESGDRPPVETPPRASATYSASAVVKNRGAAPGSANYRAYAVLGS